MVAGLGMAGLLVAAPALAQTGSSGSSTGSSGSSDTSKSGSSTMGAPSSSGSSMGTSGSATGSTTGSSADKPSTGMSSSSASNQVTGKVQKLDKSKKELTLALPVSDSTQVTKNGQTATLNDIKEGDQVRASFSGSGDTLQVTSIEVLSKGATTPAPAAPSKGGSTGGMGSSGSSSGSTGTGSSGSSTGSSGQGSSPGKGY